MTSTGPNAAKIVKTSTSQVLAAVTAATNLAKYVVLKPFTQAIATAVRNAILAVAAAVRTVQNVLAKLIPVLIGFLAHVLGLGAIGDFARNVLGRLT